MIFSVIICGRPHSLRGRCERAPLLPIVLAVPFIVVKLNTMRLTDWLYMHTHLSLCVHIAGIHMHTTHTNRHTYYSQFDKH